MIKNIGERFGYSHVYLRQLSTMQLILKLSLAAGLGLTLLRYLIE